MAPNGITFYKLKVLAKVQQVVLVSKPKAKVYVVAVTAQPGT